MSARKLVAIAFVTVLFSGAGCSSKSDSSSGNTSNQATLPQCPSAATLSSELGITYGEPATTGTAKERNCAYLSTDSQPSTAMVHFQLLPAAADFAAVKVGYGAGGRTTADISGLGDQAFSSVLSAGGTDINTVAALKGKLHVLVTSRASIDKEKALVAKLLG